MTLPVYVDAALTEAPVGAQLTLGGDEGRHAATVRRTRVGELLDVVNGRGLRATIEVTATSKSALSGIVRHSHIDHDHCPHITLVQALAKGGRDEQAIETSTEFGVDTVIPWQSARSVVKWADDAKADKARAKWQSTVLAAAKQSRRSWIPQVGHVMTSKQLTNAISEWTANGARVWICHESATENLVGHLSGLSDAPVVLVVGPEGGITDEEIAAFTDAGAHAVLLGEHVLRSGTAGAWAIAVIRALAGRDVQ